MQWLSNVFNLFSLLFSNALHFSNFIGLFVASSVLVGLMKLLMIIFKSDWGSANE